MSRLINASDIVTGVGLAYQSQIPPAGRFLGWGDSITAGDAAAVGGAMSHGSTFIAQAAVRSGLVLCGNAGVPGERTDQILARLSQVVALAPKVVHLMCGTNDCGSSSPNTVATAFGFFQDCVLGLVRNRITPIVGSLPPRPDATVREVDGLTVGQATSRLRRLQSKWCIDNGVRYIDYYDTLVNRAGTYEQWATEIVGGASAALSSDGIHPTTPTGVHRMGAILGSVLSGVVAIDRNWETQSITDDPMNMIPAATAGAQTARGWLLDSNADNSPDGWTAADSVSGHTMGFTAVNGVRWWNVTIPAASSGTLSRVFVVDPSSASPRGWAAGDMIRCAVRISTSNCRNSATAGVRIGCYINIDSTGGKIYCINAMMDVSDGLAMMDLVVPATATRLWFYLEAVTTGTRTLDSTVSFARPGLWNLTRLGLT